MSILVRGMKMPNEPRNCKFYDIDPMGFRKPYCKVQSVCNGLEDCPLIEVPEPHGRLIDADALRLTNCTECTLWGKTCFGNNQDCDWDCIYHIDHAETVIPASEVET